MKTVQIITLVLLIVGGLNWGLVAVARFDLVAAIFGMHFGETSVLSSVIYLLVGASALVQILGLLGAGKAPVRVR
jgi:uncharacterized protein